MNVNLNFKIPWMVPVRFGELIVISRRWWNNGTVVNIRERMLAITLIDRYDFRRSTTEIVSIICIGKIEIFLLKWSSVRAIVPSIKCVFICVVLAIVAALSAWTTWLILLELFAKACHFFQVKQLTQSCFIKTFM